MSNLTVLKLKALALIFDKPANFVLQAIEDGSLLTGLKEVFPQESWDTLVNPCFSLEELERDYLYLFIGVSKPLASPYASSYYKEKSRLMDKPAKEILALLKKWSIHVESDYKDLPDHIVFILQLLVVLKEMKDNLDDDKLPVLEGDMGNLKNLLLAFTDDFFERIKNNENTCFYSLFENPMKESLNSL